MDERLEKRDYTPRDGDTVLVVGQKTSKSSRVGQVLLRIVQIIALVIASVISIESALHTKPASAIHTYEFDPHKTQYINDWKQPRAQYQQCEGTSFSFTSLFEYNLTKSNDHSWHVHDLSPASANKTLRGIISIQRGSPFQTSDIEVQVVARSTHSEDLTNVHFTPSPQGLDVQYFPQDESSDTICTDIRILALLRTTPTRNMQTLNIHTSLLDIDIKDTLAWTISDLIAHTSHGAFTLGTQAWDVALTIHNFRASSLTGYILASLAAHGNISISNVHGAIGVPLLPRNSGEDFHLDSFNLTTQSGDIRTEVYRVADGTWPPQTFDHSTHIHSVSGGIRAAVPHGALTNLSSVHNMVLAALFPAATGGESEIHTYSETAGTSFRLWDVLPAWRGASTPPLRNVLSTHRDGCAQGEYSLMRLKYPASWFGRLEARIGSGRLEFEGEDLEDVERGEGYVSARRGEGESRMSARVGEGSMRIFVGADGYDFPPGM